MRQRSMRRKPLYLVRRLSMVGWNGEILLPEPAWLDVLGWWLRIAHSAMGWPSYPIALSSQG